MQIHIKPINRKTERLALTKPSTALQFRKNELAQLASGRNFTLTLIANPSVPWAMIEVVDGYKRKHTVEVFDRFSVKCQCSCEDFVEDQSNYCVHIAALDNVKNNQAIFRSQDKTVPAWYSLYHRKIANLPMVLTGYRNPKFTYYDSATRNFLSFGGSLPGAVDSSATKTAKKLKAVLASQKALASSMPEPDDTGLLANLTLYDYQKAIFAKMVKAKRAICSMTMGAGKTLTTICCYAWLRKNVKSNPKLLVVCPKSLRLQWQSEIKRSIGLESIQVTKPTDIQKVGDIFITTYQYFTRHADVFSKAHFDCVVADEIQFVKNADTKTWKAMSRIKSEYFYGLSGTVIENRLDDLYHIMEIVSPGFLGPKWKFDDKYQNLISISKAKILYKGAKNISALQAELRDYVFSYDQLTLPKITYNTINTTLTQTEMSAHDEFMEKAKELIAKSLNGGGLPHERLLIQAYLLKARQACNGEELLTKVPSRTPSSKVKEFLNLVNTICVNQKEKLVVFSEWTEMLEVCKRHLSQKLGNAISWVNYTGKETPKQRAAALLKFQTDPKCMIFFASEAGGIGLDGLQLAAWNVVHLELPWNPSRLDQRTGRVYRLLQKNPVNVYNLISNGGIEKQISKLLTEKREVRELTLKELSVG